MFKLILLAFLVTACGTDDRQASTPAAPKADNGALYIDKPENRPDCTDVDEERLIYVVSDQAFYTCHSAAWILVDINGKDGRDGRSGADGNSAKDGKDGTAGKDGTNGTDGKDYHDSSDLWFDPFTGDSWLKLVGTFNRAEAAAACTGSYRLPTGAETHNAVDRGLAREYYEGSTKRMWVSDLTATGYSMSVDLWSTSTTFAEAQGMGPDNLILAYCIKAN